MGASWVLRLSVALAAVTLFVAPAAAVDATAAEPATVAAADKQYYGYTYVPIGKPCGYRVRCAGSAVCYKGKCVAKYGGTGAVCDKPAGVLCRYGHVCEGGRCLKWTSAGGSCAPTAFAKCYGGLSCIDNVCKNWVAAGGSCASPSTTACYKGLSCVDKVCKKWVGVGGSCADASKTICYTSLRCVKGKCIRCGYGYKGPGCY